MKASDFIKRRIRNRASLLQLLAGAQGNEPLDRPAALKQAARDIASERRRAKPSPTAPAMDKLTPQTARRLFLAYLDTLGRRLRAAPPVRRNRLTPEAVNVRPHVEDPIAVAPPPAPEPASDPVLIFSSTSSTAQLVGDDQFHTSLHSPVTQQWRASLERHERMRVERGRGRWIG
jgi:hypothetical protein